MINILIERYPRLSYCESEISKAAKELIACFEKGGKLLLCGNGGSAADCEHISGELMKGFLKKRPLSEKTKAQLKSLCPESAEFTHKLQCGLPAVCLSSMTSLNTAFSNDEDGKLVYAQGVFALGRECDVLLCLSTSGNAENVLFAAKTAKALGLKVISLSGRDGGKLKDFSDICICVPESETFKIQELHLPVYHCLCAMTEEHFFND